MPYDWGSVGETGYYYQGMAQKDLIKRLLMYGYGIGNRSCLAYGDVYGLWFVSFYDAQHHAWEKLWDLSNAPVGFMLHGMRTPTHQ